MGTLLRPRAGQTVLFPASITPEKYAEVWGLHPEVPISNFKELTSKVQLKRIRPNELVKKLTTALARAGTIVWNLFVDSQSVLGFLHPSPTPQNREISNKR